LARQNVIEHLRPAAMQHRPPSVAGNGPVEKDQRSSGKRRVPGFLAGGDDKAVRRLVILGVEVAGNCDQTLRVARENLVDQQPKLQCLCRSLTSCKHRTSAASRSRADLSTAARASKGTVASGSKSRLSMLNVASRIL
jgi:hypothetical protein